LIGKINADIAACRKPKVLIVFYYLNLCRILEIGIHMKQTVIRRSVVDNEDFLNLIYTRFNAVNQRKAGIVIHYDK
jgi:hypothetical protein